MKTNRDKVSGRAKSTQNDKINDAVEATARAHLRPSLFDFVDEVECESTQNKYCDQSVLQDEASVAVASLLNADGGTVWVGVTDAGEPRGLEIHDFNSPRRSHPANGNWKCEAFWQAN